MSCTPSNLTVTQGGTFQVLARIPDDYADGFFAGYTVESQLRTVKGGLIADLNPEWVDPGLTRVLRLKVVDTSSWPLGSGVFDIRFTSPTGERIFTSREALLIVQGVTQ